MAHEVVEAAPTAKVVAEQVAYLMVHESGCHMFDCPDCERWREIRRVLLRPFRTLEYDWARRSKSRAA